MLVAEVRQVGSGHTQHDERNFVPLHAGTGIEINTTPAAQPDTLEDAGLGIVIVIVSTQESLKSYGMAQCQDRCFTVHLQTTALGVDIKCTRTVLYLCSQLRGTDFLRTEIRGTDLGQRNERHVTRGVVRLHLQAEQRTESPHFLSFKGQLLTVVEHHLVCLRPAE